MERVPPSGIAAWGPQGEIIDTDARTYAVMQAKQDLKSKEQVVQNKQLKVSEAETQLLQLKADVAYQKRRIAAMASQRANNDRFENDYDDSVNHRLSSASVRRKIRILNEEVEDAGRYLRRTRGELKIAQEKLNNVQDRHWALLRQSEADETFHKSSSNAKNGDDESDDVDVVVEDSFIHENKKTEGNDDDGDFIVDENEKSTSINTTATFMKDTNEEPDE